MFSIKKSVKGKLGLGFGLILVLVAALGAYSLVSLEHTSNVTDRIYAKNLSGLSEIARVNVMLNGMQADMLRVLNTNDVAGLTALSDRMAATQTQIEKVWSQYYPARLTTDAERQAAKALHAEYEALAPMLTQFTQTAQDAGLSAANDLYNVMIDAPFNELRAQLSELAAYQVEGAAEFHATGQQLASQEKTTIVAIMVGVLLLTFVITVLLTRMITRPLADARALVASIGEGRLDNTVHNPYRDEFGTMLDGLARMQQRLADIVHQVSQSSDSVSTGASQIASGNDELSNRTQEQAANLEETAASMEQMTSTVKQNADNAAQADQLARGVRAQASEGGEVVGRAVTAMQEIDASSRKVAEIVSLIDDIAFQTNLLALNASVEAARAGEQGRGFAVVASEVRNLASRSATAAKDIKALVEDSAAKVSDGSREVALSGQTLDEIVESVNKVGDIISEIAAASNEQSGGIEQVNLAVSQMDSMTQQNASLVEESAAASRSLEEQAGALKRQIAFFRLRGEDAEKARSVETVDAGIQRARKTAAATERAAPKTPARKAAAAPETAAPRKPAKETARETATVSEKPAATPARAMAALSRKVDSKKTGSGLAPGDDYDENEWATF